jgi:hypothetical protein
MADSHFFGVLPLAVFAFKSGRAVLPGPSQVAKLTKELYVGSNME